MLLVDVPYDPPDGSYWDLHRHLVTSEIHAAVNSTVRDRASNPVESIAWHLLRSDASRRKGDTNGSPQSPSEVNSVEVTSTVLSAANDLRLLIAQASQAGEHLVGPLTSIILKLEKASLDRDGLGNIDWGHEMVSLAVDHDVAQWLQSELTGTADSAPNPPSTPSTVQTSAPSTPLATDGSVPTSSPPAAAARKVPRAAPRPASPRGSRPAPRSGPRPATSPNSGSSGPASPVLLPTPGAPVSAPVSTPVSAAVSAPPHLEPDETVRPPRPSARRWRDEAARDEPTTQRGTSHSRRVSSDEEVQPAQQQQIPAQQKQQAPVQQPTQPTQPPRPTQQQQQELSDASAASVATTAAIVRGAPSEDGACFQPAPSRASSRGDEVVSEPLLPPMAIGNVPQAALSMGQSLLDCWSPPVHADVIALHTASGGHALSVLGELVFTRHQLVGAAVRLPTLRTFLARMEAEYGDNPYHCSIHGADVMLSVHLFLSRFGFVHRLSRVQLLAALVGAIVHDFRHPGTTNAHEVKVRTHRATLHSDSSVLERHHLASAFSVLDEPGHTLLEDLNPDEYQVSERHRGCARTDCAATALWLRGDCAATARRAHVRVIMRKTEDGACACARVCVCAAVCVCAWVCDGQECRGLIIELVLHTDLSKHFEFVARLNSLASSNGYRASAAQHTRADGLTAEWRSPYMDADVRLVLVSAIKFADLGHVTKPFASHRLWVERVTSELYALGDHERRLGVPISWLCDRERDVDVAKSQIGFMQVVCMPFLKVLADLVAGPGMEPYINAQENFWQWHAAHNEEKLSAEESSRMLLRSSASEQRSLDDLDGASGRSSPSSSAGPAGRYAGLGARRQTPRRGASEGGCPAVPVVSAAW
jgi:hypothetical protein